MIKKTVIKLTGLTFLLMAFTMCRSHQGPLPSTPQEALSELMAGNERFVNEKSINPHSDMDRIDETCLSRRPITM